MYMKKEDFTYFDSLYRGLEEEERKKFSEALLKSGKDRIGEDISKIQILDGEMLNAQGLEQKEIITRTMIKKAYKAAREKTI